MRCGPKPRRNGQGIDPAGPPPRALVAAPVELADDAAGRSGTVKRSLTLRPIARCPANLMWWGSEGVRPQHQAGLSGDEPQMVTVALADRFANDDDRPGRRARFSAARPGFFAVWVFVGEAARLLRSGAACAAKAASTVWASVVASWFFSGSTRCAQLARASASLSCPSSAISWRRSLSEASGDSLAAFAPFRTNAAFRGLNRRAGRWFDGRAVMVRRRLVRPPVGFFGPLEPAPRVGRSGASRSSSPAIPTRVNSA